MNKYGSIFLSVVLAACGGGSGASVSTSKAVKPATVAEAKADLAGSLTALNFTGDFSSVAGVGKPNHVANKLAQKLIALQDESDVEGGSDGFGEVCAGQPNATEDGFSCDCKGGGSISISGLSSADSIESAGSAQIKMQANNCLQSNGEGENSLADGVIEISVTASDTGFSVDLSIDGRFEDTKADGTVEFALVADNLVQGIDSTVDQEGYNAALAEYQEEVTSNADAEQPEADDFFTFSMTIDGAIDYTDAAAACSNGVYVFETISALQAGGNCGYKAGELKVNGVSYTFAESDVTLGEGLDGTISCEELQGNACEE